MSAGERSGGQGLGAEDCNVLGTVSLQMLLATGGKMNCRVIVMTVAVP